MDLSGLFKKAMESKGALRKLNFILLRGIPFNKPHRLRIIELGPGKAEVRVPFIRRNKNHLNGMHACCLATCAEYTSGLVMLSSLDAKKYRLIMERIEVEYHYQGKMSCTAKYAIDEQDLHTKIIEPLESTDRVSHVAVVEIHDESGSHICTSKVTWQVKAWKSVKTKA
jgi:acyl-coenzyme A thioesterase PaaI-like protein